MDEASGDDGTSKVFTAGATGAVGAAGVAVRAGVEAEAVSSALQMMVQALAHMQEAMQTMTIKMYRTDETVHAVAQTVQRLEVKLDTIERGLHIALQRGSGDRVGATSAMQGSPSPCPPPPAVTGGARHSHRRRRMLSMVPLEATSSAKNLPVMLVLNNSHRHHHHHRSVALLKTTPSTTSLGNVTNVSNVANVVNVADVGEVADMADVCCHAAPVPETAVSAFSLLTSASTSSSSSRSSAGQRVARGTSDTGIRASAHSRHMALGRSLLRAAQDGNTNEVRKLLKEGADVDFTNSSKWTPLHMASVKAHADVVSLLLERGADANAKNTFGFAPLHMAARNDKSGRCASLLIYAGCDVDCGNRFGRTPLHYAAECGNEPAVRALLAAGASRNVVNDEGRSPFHVAKTDCLRRLLAPFAIAPM